MSVIEVRNLHKIYRGCHAVMDVSFSVEEGEIFGVVGPNGAGKTTTIECVVGLRKPDSGTVRVLGINPHEGGSELRHRVGVQLQKSELPEKLRVGEALALYSSFYRRPADINQLMVDLDIHQKSHTPFGKLSGGQKQRLSIALALVGNPEVVVLDELTTGLDPQARLETWQLVKRIRGRGVTVLLVTHFMDEVERLCDRVAVIDRGRMIALDAPAALISQLNLAQCVRFRPSKPIDLELLEALPEVRSVSEHLGELLVQGNGDLLGAITTALARQGVAPVGLVHERATMEDAFMALTARRTADNVL